MIPFTFVTTDGIAIYGIRNNVTAPIKHILCLHMMPATKESYLPLLERAASLDWCVSAIDFRGHGESTEQGLDYHKFSASEHQKYLLDALEAIPVLEAIAPVDGIVGASIGANIAAIVQEHKGIHKSVLLSPGIDYYGVQPGPALAHLTDQQHVLFIASPHDPNVGENISVVEKLADQTTAAHTQCLTYDDAAHGTDLVMGDPERIEHVLAFLS